MKKIYITGLIILVLSGLVFAVTTLSNSYDHETGEAILWLHPGWNIVPYGSSVNSLAGTDCQTKAVWFWIPTMKKYFGTSNFDQTPDSTMQNLLEQIEIDNQNNYLYAQNAESFAGGHWIYVENECSIKKNFASGSGEGIDGMKLAQGWNFVTISPWMVGKTISSFLGECELLKFNAWDSADQQWVIPDNQSMAEVAEKINNGEDEPLQEQMIGMAFLWRVSQDCELGETSAQPPALPE